MFPVDQLINVMYMHSKLNKPSDHPFLFFNFWPRVYYVLSSSTVYDNDVQCDERFKQLFHANKLNIFIYIAIHCCG